MRFVCRDLCIQLYFDWRGICIKISGDLKESASYFVCSGTLWPNPKPYLLKAEVHPDFVNVCLDSEWEKPKALKGSIWFFFFFLDILLNPRKQSRKAGSLHFSFPASTSQERTLHGWVFHRCSSRPEGNDQSLM